IDETDNVGTVHDKLMTLGADLVTKTVDKILDGTITTTQQSMLYKDPSELKPAPKIFKETCKIDFNQKAKNIHNLVRGLSPYPAAWCEMVGKDGNITSIKTFETEVVSDKSNGTPGTFSFDKKNIEVNTGEGILRIKSLQYPGKKRLSVEEFLRGFKMDEVEKFS
ncbi:MAG: methionyl-tRNA formyltransferase, partial [Paludibacteraceae bacterium]|nr:methionyl-tRNA formyltransferase [Paludibacteraceae bacterium]